MGVGRIEEKERGRPVPEGEASLPVEVLDGDTVEADVELADGIHPGSAGSGRPGARAGGRDPERPEVSATKAVPVSEKPPGGTLDVGEAGLAAEVMELQPGVEHELQLGEQRIRMKADAAVKCDQVSVEVVKNFDFRAGFRQENSEATSEWLNIAFMFLNAV